MFIMINVLTKSNDLWMYKDRFYEFRGDRGGLPTLVESELFMYGSAQWLIPP